MFYYVPTPEQAYGSMLDIEHAVSLGSFMRTLHRWSALAMVAVFFLHLLRVAAAAAYRGRELNWLFGIGLFVLTLFLSFTGYLLPWDQRAYWAVAVSANLADHLPWVGSALKGWLLGGPQVGQAALIRFYTLHVFILPAALLGLMGLHLWRIRKDGGLARDKNPDEVLLPAWPHLILREGALLLAVVMAMSLLAMLLSAPLGAPPDMHNPANPEKSPWFFLWLQEMVSYSAVMGGLVFPAALGGLLLSWPWLERRDGNVGRLFGGRAERISTLVAVVVAVGAFVLFEALYLGADASSGPMGLAADLVNPATGMLALAVLAFVAAGGLARSTRAAFLAAFAVLVVALVGFVIVGLWRGPDWVFYWPWEVWPVVN